MRTYTVWEVLYYTDSDGGPAGDGSYIARFRKEADARAFARSCHYGPDATVSKAEKVPARLAQRWGVA